MSKKPLPGFLSFLKAIPAKYASYINVLRQAGRKKITMVSRLFISYFIIISICAGGMGLLSQRFVTRSIIDTTIKSNNELLNQLKNTIDSYVLGNIDKISLMILQDAADNSDIAYYFSNSIEGNLSGIMRVSRYLDSLKMANPMVNSISIYYKKSQLLVSTEGVRYLSPEFKPDKTLVGAINDLSSVKSSMWLTTNNIPFYVSTDSAAKSQILFVRKAPMINRSSEEGGFIAISITEDILYNIIKTSSVVDLGQILVINEDGVIISHSSKEYLYSNIANMDYGKKALEAEGKSNYFLTEVGGVDSAVSITSSDYNGWRYITVKPFDKIKESYGFLGKIILTISSLIFIFALFVSLVSTTTVYSPIKILTNSCREIITKASSEVPRSECEIIGSTLNILTDKLGEQERKLASSFPVLKHHLMMDLIDGDTIDGDEIKSRFDMLKISLPFEYYGTLIINVGKLPRNMDLRTFEVAKLDLIDHIEKHTVTEDMKCLCTEINSELIVVCNTGDEHASVELLAAQASKHIYSTLKLRTYIGIGSTVSDIKNLIYSYVEARNCIKYSYIYPDKYVFKPSDISGWEMNNEKVSPQLLEDFCSSMKTQTRAGALSSIKKLLDTIQQAQLSYSFSMKLISKVIFFIDGFIEQMGIDTFQSEGEDIHAQFNCITNINDLEDWLVKLVDQIFIGIDGKRSHRNSELADRVKSFIEKNYDNPELSLNSAANAMYISPNYLSRIFKEETGINFVDFLADFRLQKAQLLVLSSDMKIEEISFKAGYSSPQYFIKKFKSKYGLTPREYRYRECCGMDRPFSPS